MNADGFSLDDKRNPVAENDIPDIVARFHNLEGETERTRKDKSFFVPVEEIRTKGYSLSMRKYSEVEQNSIEYESSDEIFSRIVSLESDICVAFDELRQKLM